MSQRKPVENKDIDNSNISPVSEQKDKEPEVVKIQPGFATTQETVPETITQEPTKKTKKTPTHYISDNPGSNSKKNPFLDHIEPQPVPIIETKETNESNLFVPPQNQSKQVIPDNQVEDKSPKPEEKEKLLIENEEKNGVLTSKERINSRIGSPQNETKSILSKQQYSFIGSTSRFMGIEYRDQFEKYKTEIKALKEQKVTAETSLEISVKRNEIYQKEISELKKLVSTLRSQHSRTNEENTKLEISKLNQHLTFNEREKQILSKENAQLKAENRKLQESLQNVLEENIRFRSETEKRFGHYNHEIEKLQSSNSAHDSLHLANSKSADAFYHTYANNEATQNHNEAAIIKDISYNAPVQNPNDNATNSFKRETQKSSRPVAVIESAEKEVKVSQKLENEVKKPDNIFINNEEPIAAKHENKISNNTNVSSGLDYNDHNINDINSGYDVNEYPSIQTNGDYNQMPVEPNDNLQDHQYVLSQTSQTQKANTGETVQLTTSNYNGFDAFIDDNNNSDIQINHGNLAGKGESGATNNINNLFGGNFSNKIRPRKFQKC